MKKILCLFIIATLSTGCSPSSPKDDKEEYKKVAETDKSDKAKEDIKETDKESDNKKDESPDQEENKSNEVASSSTKKDNGDSKQPSSGSSNTNDGSNSNTGGSTTPPKQETPTPPKEETPTPAPTPPVPATPTEQRGKADAVMAQINAYRQQNGKPSFLVTNYLLDNSKKHAYAMAEKRALWHSGAAECITNYDDPFSAWVNSPEHNKLLLSNNETGAVSIYYVDGYYFSVFQTLP